MNLATAASDASPLVDSPDQEQLEQLRIDIQQSTNLLEETMKQSIQHGLQIGELLTKAKALVKHGEWLSWFHDSGFRFSERSAHRFMQLYRDWPKIESRIEADPNRRLWDLTLDAALNELKLLSGHSATLPKNNKSNIATKAPTSQPADSTSLTPPMATIVESVAECWLTPSYIVDAVVHTLSVIDLDPASDGSHIPATNHYTVKDNGLREDRPWRGKVFLNPPTDDKAIVKFVDRLFKEYKAEQVTEAIILLPAMTDTIWFRNLTNLMRCFLTRPEFENLEVERPLVAFYLGERVNNFYMVFSKLGGLFVPYRPSHEEPKRPRLFGRSRKARQKSGS